MTSSTTVATKTLTSLFLCLALFGRVDAFSVSGPVLARVGTLQTGTSARTTSAPAPVPVASVRTVATTVLSMSDEEAAGEDAPAGEEEAEEAAPPEDPEVTALKESIADLEATLADKKSKLQYELERCEEYSKSGYARKVADMENMKRVRSNIASTSKASATAAILKEFLPIYDTLNVLRETYSGDEFGSKYSELNLEQTFANLGVTPFDVQQGDKINNFRMKVLESEPSADVARDTVLRSVAPGLELEGNVVRAAICVGSSGPESSSEAEEGGAAAEAAAADDGGEEEA